MNPKQIGCMTEMQCMTAMCECGCKISIPFGEDSRYDFIADVEGVLYKVQVKTSRQVDDNSFEFSCLSTKSKRNGNVRRRYNKCEIDFFATFYDGICYIVPVEECGATKRLHLSECKNNQKHQVSFASDYKLSNIIKHLHSTK